MKRGATSVIVLGMHRSGTTALTGVLALMGVDIGDDKKDADLLEDVDIQKCNKRLLERYDVSWKLEKPFELSNREFNLQFKKELKPLLERKFSNSMLFGFKDPRISLLVPLYRQALSELGVTNRLFIVMRRPLEECAKSLMRRLDVSNIEEGVVMGRKYINAIYDGLGNEERIELDFRDLLTDPSLVLSLYEKLYNRKIGWPVLSNICGFLDPNKKHF